MNHDEHHDDDVTEILRRHHPAPEPPVDVMWARIRTAVAETAWRRRRHRMLSVAAGIAAVVIAGVLFQQPRLAPGSSSAVSDASSRALRDTVSELDAAIGDLDAILRSDPANQVVKEMRARFGRQRDAWLARKEP